MIEPSTSTQTNPFNSIINMLRQPQLDSLAPNPNAIGLPSLPMQQPRSMCQCNLSGVMEVMGRSMQMMMGMIGKLVDKLVAGMTGKGLQSPDSSTNSLSGLPEQAASGASPLDDITTALKNVSDFSQNFGKFSTELFGTAKDISGGLFGTIKSIFGDAKGIGGIFASVTKGFL